MSFAPGTKLGPYEVTARLGRGGMGEVYRARDTRLGRDVALKVLAGGPAENPEHRRRFEQEAKAASALTHPNVAQIYDVGLEGGVLYLAMELVEGRTLRQMLHDRATGDGRALPIDRVLELGTQIASGVARAHERGIVHRDLKPENVMVTPEGWVKILDFGLAKLTSTWLEGSDDAATIPQVPTRDGQLLGTAEYMSPEQAAGRPVDHRSDQFALGSILYEMATGRFAFRRDSPVLTLAAILEREPEPLAQAASGSLAPGFERVVRRCLRKQPQDRYATTAELVAELEAVAAGEAPAERAAKETGGLAPLAAEAGAMIERAENRGGAIGAVASAVLEVTDELGKELGLLNENRYYYLQDRHGRTKRLLDRELVERLRAARVAGDELIRRGDEAAWTPLAETELFRREIPDVSRMRALQRRRFNGFLLHAASFCFAAAATTAYGLTVGSILEGTWSELAVLTAWGIGLGVHGLYAWRARPALASPREAARLDAARPAALPERQPRPPVVPATPAAEPEFVAQLARVRALVEERGGDEAPAQRAELGRLEAVLSELDHRRRQLEAQVSDSERAGVVDAEIEAQMQLERAANDTDRRLHEDRLRALRERRAAIDRARAESERVAIRLSLAEHQLKLLLLDLTREAAAAIDTPELSSRLQVIRSEADLERE